jgi:hypothetical protein
LAESLADEALYAINPAQADKPARPLNNSTAKGAHSDPSEKVKHAAYERMNEYAKTHPNAIPSKIFRIPNEERRGQLAELFKTYGFSVKHFKGAKCTRQDGDTSIVEAEFYSPKISKECYIDFELKKTGTGWRLEKIANLHQTVMELEPTYDRDLQELAMTAAKDVRSALTDTANVIKEEIKKKVADKLEEVREKVTEGIKEKLEEKRAEIGERLPQGPPGGNGPPGPGFIERLRERRASTGPVEGEEQGPPAFPILRRRLGDQN